MHVKNKKLNSPPFFTSDTLFNSQENQVAIGTVSVTDDDGAVEDARFGDDISLSDDGKKITIRSSEDRKIYTYTRN
tara:strand:+ start:3971 stop:4198 length:228 start_codon:yes stop_codon:yes gene_type:complete